MTQFVITDDVLHALANAIPPAAENGASSPCFRLDPDGEGNLQLHVAQPEPSDEVYSFDGREIVAVPTDVASAYAGKTLDINEAGDFLIV